MEEKTQKYSCRLKTDFSLFTYNIYKEVASLRHISSTERAKRNCWARNCKRTTQTKCLYATLFFSSTYQQQIMLSRWAHETMLLMRFSSAIIMQIIVFAKCANARGIVFGLSSFRRHRHRVGLLCLVAPLHLEYIYICETFGVDAERHIGIRVWPNMEVFVRNHVNELSAVDRTGQKSELWKYYCLTIWRPIWVGLVVWINRMDIALAW